MPIYEYRCPKCGDFEEMQKISDPPLQRCPTCRKKVSKLISNTSFQLKGSGWYVTDYAKKGTSGSEKTEAADKSEKKDSKPEKKESSSKDTTTPKASAAA